MTTRDLELHGGASLPERSGWPLWLPCAGLNLLVAALAAGGAHLGAWLADADGAAVGLAAGLMAGLVGQAFGVEAIARRQSRG